MTTTIFGLTKRVLIAMGLMVLLYILVMFILGLRMKSQTDYVSPISSINLSATKVEAKTETTGRTWKGTASYYSRSGCVGCSKNLHMANGQPLDDLGLTVAFNRSPLGSKVRITNPKNGLAVVATVTDRGGFERLNRIIDLTVATKNSIKCSSLCYVVIEEIK